MTCLHGEGWLVVGGSPALMIAGAIAISVGVNALLGYRRGVFAALPRAILVTRR